MTMCPIPQVFYDDASGTLLGEPGDRKLASLRGQAVSNTACLLGDSRLGPVSYPNSASLRSIWNWAQVQLNQRWVLLNNGAVGGENTSQMLGRLGPSILDYNPAVVVVLAGLNDIAQDATNGATNAITNLCGVGGIYDQITDSGAVVLACLEYPASGVYVDATRREGLLRLNNAILAKARTRRGIIPVDLFSPILDPTSATGDQRSGTLYDNIHLSILGVSYAGPVLAEALRPLTPPLRPIITSLTDVVSAAYPTGNIVTNGGMTGTGGTNSGTGMSGTVASSWVHQLETGTATSVASQVARTDGLPGNRQVLTITGGAANSVVRLRQIPVLPAQVGPGDTVEVFAEIDVSGITGNVDGVQIYLQWQNSSSATLQTDFFPATSADAFQNISGIFRGIPVTIPATCDRVVAAVRVQLDNAATVVVSIGSFVLRKVVN